MKILLIILAVLFTPVILLLLLKKYRIWKLKKERDSLNLFTNYGRRRTREINKLIDKITYRK